MVSGGGVVLGMRLSLREQSVQRIALQVVQLWHHFKAPVLVRKLELLPIAEQREQLLLQLLEPASLSRTLSLGKGEGGGATECERADMTWVWALR